MTTQTAPQTTDPRRTALLQAITDIERGFNDNDVESMVRHFSAGAVVIDPRGRVLVGIDAIRSAHEAGVAGFLADEFVRYVVDEITFPTPDVAIVRNSGIRTDSAGVDLEAGPAMRGLYVFTLTDRRWLITHRQNTAVA